MPGEVADHGPVLLLNPGPVVLAVRPGTGEPDVPFGAVLGESIVAELLFEVFSQRYERGSILVTTNLPFDEWTEVFGSERLTGALLDRLTRHVHILEMNGESYRLKHSRDNSPGQALDDLDNP